MAAPRPWTVLPHQPLVRHEDNLWSVQGTLPRGSMWRSMHIVRLDDGRLAFHNAIPLDAASMSALEAWGEPAFLLVSNGFHRLDVHAFKERYPAMQVLCPAPDVARVSEKVHVDGSFDRLPGGGALGVEIASGVKNGEAIFVVGSGPDHARRSLLFGDTLFNLPHLPGLDGWLFRMLGSTGSCQITRVARLLIVSDLPALRAHLGRLARLDGLTRLLFTHGAAIEGPAASTLAALAG